MVFLSRRLRAVAAAAVIGTALLIATSAQGSLPHEDAVKAAFLYNFTKFVDWPEGAFAGSGAPFNVCVYADDGFQRELRSILSNEQVRGRRITITPLKNGDDLRTCHLVYFGPQHLDRSARRLPTLKQAPVLTVGEGRRFLEQGGLIAFLLEDNRVRFDISKRAADAAGLIVSSKLLRVARQIDGSSLP